MRPSSTSYMQGITRSATSSNGKAVLFSVGWPDLSNDMALADSLAVPNSLVATEPHELHRKRRAAVNPYFSKQNVRRLDPIIVDSLRAILKRLDDSATSGKPWHASLAFKAATCDIITYFSFGESTKYMEQEDYNEVYFKAVDDHLHMGYRMTYISWLGPLMDRIPPTVMGWVYPGLKSLWSMHAVSSHTIYAVIATPG